MLSPSLLRPALLRSAPFRPSPHRPTRFRTARFRTARFRTSGPSRRAGLVRLACAGVLVAALAGCSASGQAGPTASATATSTAAVTIENAWVSVPRKDAATMTAAYASVVNHSARAVRVVSASSPVAGRVQLHEWAVDGAGAMQMRPKSGGITVPARSTVTLRPGHDHVMLMDLDRRIETGDEVALTLRLSDGTSVSVTALARNNPNNSENYDANSDTTNGGMSPSMGASSSASGSASPGAGK